MRKIIKTIVNVLQVILPLLFFVYFDHYMLLKESIRTSDISLIDMLGHVLVYFLLLILFIYAAVSSHKSGSSIVILALGWIEAVILCVLPFTFVWRSELFIRIKGYPIDYLHVYGIIVLLYSVQLVYFYRSHYVIQQL